MNSWDEKLLNLLSILSYYLYQILSKFPNGYFLLYWNEFSFQSQPVASSSHHSSIQISVSGMPFYYVLQSHQHHQDPYQITNSLNIATFTQDFHGLFLG